MMVLHESRIIFLKPRKVAGTSLEIALSAFAGPRDVITPISPDDEAYRGSRGFRGPQNHRFGLVDKLAHPRPHLRALLRRDNPPRRFYNHMPAAEARGRLGAEIWSGYRKLSLVRNPFDRVISAYFWRVRRSNLQPEELDFEAWCLGNPDMIRQNRPVYEIDGQPVIDRFIRFEALEEDLRGLEVETPKLAGL